MPRIRYDDLLQAHQAIERETDLDADRGSGSGAEIAASEGAIREPGEGTNRGGEGHSNISNALRDKPAGQPNRPNSGGYSLEETLLGDGNWTKENFQKLMARIYYSSLNCLTLRQEICRVVCMNWPKNNSISSRAIVRRGKEEFYQFARKSVYSVFAPNG